MAGRAAISAFFLASAISACATRPHLYFDPEVLDAELRGKDGHVEGRLVAVWRGVGEQDGVPELRFRVRVENRRDVPLKLVPAEFKLLGSESIALGKVRGAGLPDAVESGGSVTLELAFPLPARATRALEQRDFTLRVRLDGGHWEWNAEFQYDYQSGDPSWG